VKGRGGREWWKKRGRSTERAGQSKCCEMERGDQEGGEGRVGEEEKKEGKEVVSSSKGREEREAQPNSRFSALARFL